MTAVDLALRHPDEREAAKRTAEEQRAHEAREVAQHYEHNPEIFSLVLDKRLAYSTGVFLSPEENLETGQERKFARVAAKLNIQPGERVLDVGCGWGSLLLYLAQHTQGQFQGITLSSRQREVALQRAKDWGVADRVRVDLTHVEAFNPPPESYDVVLFSGSIVHMHNREAIHQLVGRTLKPGGRLFISDCYFPEQSRGNRDSNATRYIFVTALGYCRLLSLSEELGLIERAGLDLLHVEDLTSSYVQTLGHWIDNVRANRERIEAMAPGFSRVLQGYMTVAKLSFARRTALEYMILATKGAPKVHVAGWPIPGNAR
ncbi:MAG TPA: class I SAM-dependent methyltransferase [Myxococcaceae bacterium]|nr:class I SAM-dependent methyltransferase [Myxococcaceae bacterium]